MKREFLLLALASLILASCSTPYGEMGLMGGVESTPLSSDREMISARGNGFTDPSKIQQFVLLRSADDCLANGYAKFIFISNQDTSRSGAVYVPGQTQSYSTVNGYGNTATVTTNTYSTPGSVIPIFKPGEMVIVQFLRSGDPRSANAFDAATISRNLGRKLKN